MRQFDFKKIREFREAAGMTQNDLARKMGIHSQQICEFESERMTGLNTRTLTSLCDALGKVPNDFLSESRRD